MTAEPALKPPWLLFSGAPGELEAVVFEWAGNPAKMLTDLADLASVAAWDVQQGRTADGIARMVQLEVFLLSARDLLDGTLAPAEKGQGNP